MRILRFSFPIVGFIAISALVLSCDGIEEAANVSSDPGGLRQTSSRSRLTFSTDLIPGYERTIDGEELEYHSPIPAVEKSLLVRSIDRSRSISWESAEVPDHFAGESALFVMMFGIDVNEAPRQYELLINGESILEFTNPSSAVEGDTLVWIGERGVSAKLAVSLIDRHGDAMGYLYMRVPREFWQSDRSIRFDVFGESAGVPTWFMIFKEQLGNRVEISNAPSLLKSADGVVQTIRVEMLDLEGGRPFQMRSSIGQIDTSSVLGHNRFLLPVNAVSDTTSVAIQLVLGSEEKSAEYDVVPVRKMEVYLIPHTHVDIGYTHHQDEVERMQWDHLEEALRLGQESAGYPEGSRFVWNPESIWAVDSYVRNHPGAKTDALMHGIRQGWIELDGLFGNLLTGIANEEGLLRAFDASRRLSEMSGVPIRSEMVSDIPGFTWGLVDAMARNGIEYLSIGPNFGHRIGHFTEKLGDKPFYWESASGRDRILTWVSGAGYAWFHTGLGFVDVKTLLDEDSVFRYLDQLTEQHYPFDITHMRYNIGSDNGPPDSGLSDAVRDWNERFESPKLRISGATELFDRFEKMYGDDLPVLRGDMTGYWEDGAASSAKETALVRRTAEALAQTERWAEQTGVALQTDILEEAWRNVLLYYEHTWGSWNSVSEPEAELTLTSWQTKAGFAVTASELSRQVRDEAVRSLDLPADGSVEVFNTLDWERSDLVVLPADAENSDIAIEDETGFVVPSQRLSSGEFAFLAVGIPASGSRHYRIVQNRSGNEAYSGENSDRQTNRGSTVVAQNSMYRLAVDQHKGTIQSLIHIPAGRELVASNEQGLNEYVYVRGRNPLGAEKSTSTEVRWKERGPLVNTLELLSEAPGLRSQLTVEIRLVEGLDWIEIVDRVDKAWVLEPEAVLFRFPFAVDNPQVHFDVPFAIVTPEQDQLPGASKNYYSLQRWLNISGENGSVTITSIDAPLLQLGEIRTDAISTGWLDHAEPASTFYSYVMNNYWETNYRAAQEGVVELAYAIRSDDSYDEASSDRFARERGSPLIVLIGLDNSGTR